MRQVQQDFIDFITFRYDDETRRNLVKIFSKKETLLDVDLLEEHLVNQPLLGCFILFLFFLTAVSLIFAIVFVACRALGHCGSKRYQPHPTSGRRYGLHLSIFIISWVAMAISASFFIQSSVSMWNPKVPIDFVDIDHTVIKRNVSDIQMTKVKRETENQKKLSVFDLFADEDYRGDFEQTDPVATTVPSFITVTSNPEDRPIPISRNRVSTTEVKMDRSKSTEKLTSSQEMEDVPPAVDRLPIKPITEETTVTTTVHTTTQESSTRPLKKFEIPLRPKAELEFVKHHDESIQAPFVSNLWNPNGLKQAAADMPRIRQSKLQIQSIPAAETTQASVESTVSESDEEVEVTDESFEKAAKEGQVANESEAPAASHEAISTPLPTVETKTVLLNEVVTANSEESEEATTVEAQELLSMEHHDGAEKVDEEPDTTNPLFPQLNVKLDGTMVVTSSETTEKVQEETRQTTETTTISTTGETSIVPVTTVEKEEEVTEVSTESVEQDEDLVLSLTDASSLSSPTTTEVTTEQTTESTTTESTAATTETTTETTTARTTVAATESTTERTAELTTEMSTKASTTQETTSTTTIIPTTTTEGTTTEEAMEHVEMVTIPVTEATTTTPERQPLPIATNVDTQSIEFVPIIKANQEESWKPVTDHPKSAATLAIFPSVPIEKPHGKVEQLATPLIYPYQLLHTSSVIWMARLSLIVLGLIMIVVALPSLVLVLLGTFFYKSNQHPIDRKATSDQIGQLIVVLATLLLFALPLMLVFVQATLIYHHLHNAICPTLQLKYQQDLGILGPITSLTPESRDIVLRNVVNRDNCQASESGVETMWMSCLCFSIFSIPLLASLFKLSKYYLRMKTEYYWTLNDYGTIYGKRQTEMPQDIYGNLYGTVGPRRPTSRPPPVPSSGPEPSYADGPIYAEGPVYGVYQAYGRY